MVYQPIYFFGHQSPLPENAFVTIHTTTTTVRMTQDHHIPVCTTSDCNDQASFNNVPAGTVRSGQVVRLGTSAGEHDHCNGSMHLQSV